MTEDLEKNTRKEAMTPICDNKSVGMIIRNGDNILLIERKRGAIGFAPPAGHIDDFDSSELAAKGEVEEEVGLTVDELTLLGEGRKDNSCRREGGDHHYWWIYEAKTHGDIKRSESETKQAGWFSIEEISDLADRTKLYLKGEISDEEWEKSPGIEPVWYEWFKELGIL